jgi:hypothetical protein
MLGVSRVEGGSLETVASSATVTWADVALESAAGTRQQETIRYRFVSLEF